MHLKKFPNINISGSKGYVLCVIEAKAVLSKKKKGNLFITNLSMHECMERFIRSIVLPMFATLH